MSVLDAIRADRKKAVEFLAENPGYREIFESLYPDRTHFIYELLQNAEDAGATDAKFSLDQQGVSFQHNGRSFNEGDIRAITTIAQSTKRGKQDKIGCFGIGFKSVFEYTETPSIWSPQFSFEITDFLCPTAIPPKAELEKDTLFYFPFNSPRKDAKTAYAEIKAGLNLLSETTVLFLSKLEIILWQCEDGPESRVERVEHSAVHVEVRKRLEHNAVASAHFLRFSSPVAGLEKQIVCVAFELSPLPQASGFEVGKPLSTQMKVVPAIPGRVAVSFPAEKETSGLRFHLHAPFVPDVTRASVKDTP